MAKLDKICFRILSVSIVLTMCNIEPALADVNISDLLRNVVMSAEAYDSEDIELKKLSFFIEQQEQKTIQGHQYTTIIRIVPIAHTTYSKTNDSDTTVAEATKEYVPQEALVQRSIPRYEQSAIANADEVLLSSITPRAGPCVEGC